MSINSSNFSPLPQNPTALVHTPVTIFSLKRGRLSILYPKEGNAKECSNYRTIALFSHASKVMLKILQARLQQYVNRELPDVQAGFTRTSSAKTRGFHTQLDEGPETP